MDFFKRRPELLSPDAEDDDDDGDDPVEVQDEPLEAPKPLRASAYREGDLARRMMAVEDRMQVMTDYTFASLLNAATTIVHDLANVWAAFDRFCHDRLGVSATTLLTAWEFPTGDEVSEVLKRYGHVKPDPAAVDEYHGIYCRAWDRRFEGRAGLIGMLHYEILPERPRPWRAGVKAGPLARLPDFYPDMTAAL
jgi:hypothetical protein